MFEVCNINKNEDAKLYCRDIERILHYAFNHGKRVCKLYYCNAEIWECTGMLVLVSYVTPVALFTADDGKLYDCLRVVYGYTATSSQHISKLKKWLSENNYNVEYAVRFTD